MTDEIAVTRGSGNVFADLGFANPEEELSRRSSCARSATCSSGVV